MLKVELHIHTKYSYDSSTSLKEVVDVCIKKGIDAVAITDHNEIEGALRLTQIALFKVIVGQEILTKEGEITGLFIKHSIPPGLSIEETLKRIKKQGGLVYLPHPFDKFTRKTAINKNQIVKHMSNIDIIEGFNGRSVDTLSNKKAVKLANKFNKLVGIGSDAHTKYEIGRNYLEMPDFSNAEEFLKSLSRAKFKTSRVMLWPFLFTKWVRFNKRHKIFQPKAKRITGKTNCDFCGGQELLVIYKKKGQIRSKYLITDDSYGVHPQIVKCLSCNLVFSYPRDKDSQILKRYINFKDPLYEKERKERAENQRKILDEINRLTGKKGKLLEIGCATGLFLGSAKKEGWKVYGIEPSKWAAKIAREKYKLSVFNGVLEDASLKKNSFDVVVCIDIIEHVTSPKKLLVQIEKLLKPKGLLCIVTPDISSFVARIIKEKWWHIRPDHIHYFSKDSVTSFLTANNFSITKIKRYGWTFSYDYWASRFQNTSTILYKLMIAIKKIPFINLLTKNNYHINFGDSLEIYSKKVN